MAGKSPFWAWYERHYTLILWGTTLLFFLQVVHLYWLATHVVLHRLFGWEIWNPSALLQYLIIIVDYTEIPALITTSVLYIHELRKKFSWKAVLFLVLLNSQWLHLFWITDEFVLSQFEGRVRSIALPLWLAWVAIMIDFLEVPVMIDTFMKSGKALGKGGLKSALKEIAERD